MNFMCVHVLVYQLKDKEGRRKGWVVGSGCPSWVRLGRRFLAASPFQLNFQEQILDWMLICLVMCKVEPFNGYLIRTIEGQGRTEEGVQGKIETKRSCGFPFASRKLFANCSDGRGH